MSRSLGDTATTRTFARLAPPTMSSYVLGELLVPTLMGFGLFTFFLLMQFLLRLADMIITLGIGAADVGRLFVYSVPHVIVLTVPMGILVGGLVAFGRLSADSEIIAMRSGGLSLYQLVTPALLLAGAATLLNFYLCISVMPWGNDSIRQLQWRLINTRSIAGEIRPRVFETRFPNFTLYVEDVVGAEQGWDNLLLAKSDQTPPRVVMADSAEAVYDESDRTVWLELQNGYIYQGGNTAEESSVTAFGSTQELVMSESGFEVGEVSKDERSMDLQELDEEIRRLDAAGSPSAVYRVEVHKKFALPMACLVMGLIAIPLGISTHRHTKATGYLIAIGVIAVYYQFLENGEKFAEEGAVPAWLGIWSGNMVFAVAAIFLLWAKAREKDFGIADTLMRGVDIVLVWALRVWTSLREAYGFSSSPDGSDRAAGRAVGKAPFGGRRFPRTLDRYVLQQFARVFAMTLGGLIVVWSLFEYFEIADDVYAAGAGRGLIVEYFKFQLPFIFTMTIPIATILTVLIVYSLMSKHNEVVAVLAGGTSLFRLAAPMLAPALLLTATHYAISDYVVPRANVRAAEIKQSLVQDGGAPSFRPAQGHWARGKGRHIFNYADYDSTTQTFQGLYTYYLDQDSWRLSRIDYADRAEWREGAWQATDAWRRHYEYGDDGTLSSPPLMRFATTALPLTESPDYFGAELLLPAQMNAAELRRHIADLEQRGFDAGKYKVDLQQKLAFPAVVFVLTIVGIPFGFRMGRQGTLSGVAVALGLTMLFWLSFAFFRAVGSAGILPPLLAAWTPHLLFLALAGYITLGLRT